MALPVCWSSKRNLLRWRPTARQRKPVAALSLDPHPPRLSAGCQINDARIDVRSARMNAELTDLPVHALSAGLADKRFTARDIVDACLTRIDALEPKLAAFVVVYGSEARLAAEAADQARQSEHSLG